MENNPLALLHPKSIINQLFACPNAPIRKDQCFNACHTIVTISLVPFIFGKMIGHHDWLIL